MTGFFSCQLANRGILRLGGADRRAFLQGLISNDIELCTKERAIYAALLTPQGKFLHDLFIIEDSDEFLIDCEAARMDDLLTRLKAYTLRAKITLEDAREEFAVWAIQNQKPKTGNQIIFSDPRLPALGMRAIVKKDAGAFECGDFSVYDRHRLALGVMDGSRDMIVEKSTLVEGNVDFLNGISWSKGCYVGQELTARMRYRGLAKKRLFPVTIEGAAPAFGAVIKSGDGEIGDMRSGCGNLGLALLTIDATEAAMRDNAALICGASRLTVSKPTWMDGTKDG
jgi:folate-binding protein YgfZ